MQIRSNEVTVVIQGAYSKESTPLCIRSVRQFLPECKIVLSTWENAEIAASDPVDEVVFNLDPGAKTRDGKANGKLNNVNRQIVSSANGLKRAQTAYSLKLRSDFIMTGDGFLQMFGDFQKFDPSYRKVEQRIICCMPGTRRPKGHFFNLPFHVSDFSTFGCTKDLLNLYTIPLVTEEEFDWFLLHQEVSPDTYAVNKYNAEQSIIVNFLTKNGVAVPCEYSTHIDDDIAIESNRYLVNNFYPMAFGAYGVQPLKPVLRAENCIPYYTDYFTQYEWKTLYKKYCDSDFPLPARDEERAMIDSLILDYNRVPQVVRSLYRGLKRLCGCGETMALHTSHPKADFL